MSHSLGLRVGTAWRQTVEYLHCLRLLSFDHRMHRNDDRNDESTESKQRLAAQLSVPIWLALGVGIGTSLGVAMDNLALGVAIGTTAGVAIGSALSIVGSRSRTRKGAAKREVS